MVTSSAGGVAKPAMGRRRAPLAACLLMSLCSRVGGDCAAPGCLEAPRPAAGARATAFPARRFLSTCELPGESFYFSAVTDGAAQIAGEKSKGAVHIGGQLTMSPNYAQTVCTHRCSRPCGRCTNPLSPPPAHRSSTTVRCRTRPVSRCSRTLAGS